MEEEIIFEDYDIKFTDKELKEADKDTLLKCKKILEDSLKKVNKMSKEEI